MRFYHATEPSSALRLLHGEALNLAQATTLHVHHGAPIGFYLAERRADAEVFGSYRSSYSILTVDMDLDAFRALRAVGAVRRRIPGRPPPFFKGRELFIPPDVFSLFDSLRQTGAIDVHP